jgi:hypothetical protein
MNQRDAEQENLKRTLESIMKDAIPETLDARMEKAMETFRDNLRGHPHIRRLNRKSAPGDFAREFFARWIHGWNLAWSAGFLFLAALAFSSLLIGGGNPTWADVAKQFKSIPFFHAAVYAKQLTSNQAMQFEIWMGEGGKVRLQYGSQVAFAGKQGIRKTYDILERREAPPDANLIHIVKLLNSAETFSLETVIHTVTGSMADLRPVPAKVEDVSDDISIFDLARDDSSESVRIWALQKSLLPIQMQQTDVKSGDCIEVFFSYLDQQPDAFFDPAKFEPILHDASKGPTEILSSF